MRFNKIIKSVVLGMGILIGLTVGTQQSVLATIEPVPDHITNIENLFAAPPKDSSSKLPVNGVTIINPDKDDQSGAIWSSEDNKIDLSKDFTATMLLNFGDKGSNAADGMAFVMHNDPAKTNTIKLNGDGQQLGVWGDSRTNLVNAIHNSFAIEFDTHHNKNWDKNGGFLGSDLPANHIAWNYPDKAATYDTPLIGSTRLVHNNVEAFSGSDGKWHTFTVRWVAEDKLLFYYFDGVSKGPSTGISIDYTDVFKSSSVYWGFTGKTGKSSELNQVAFQSISNIPTTKQDYKIYHKNADGSRGAEVTKASPAHPNEILLGIITAQATGTSPWKDVALRYRVANADETRGVGYLNNGLTINGQPVMNGNVSTGIFKTPSRNLDGSVATPEPATDTDLFNDPPSQFGTGINIPEIPGNSTATIQFPLRANEPTATDGVTNLGQNYEVSLNGPTASQTTKKTTYISATPNLKLDQPWQGTTDEKPIVLDKGQPITLGGSWSQSKIAEAPDKHAVGTLHYSIDEVDGGAEKTIAQNNTNGPLTSGIPTTGLAMNQIYHLTVYMTNAGYNEKSNVEHIAFKIKGGTLMLKNIKDVISFNPIEVGQNAIGQRKEADWAPTVEDSRGTGSEWTLYASTSGLKRDSDQKVLSGGLVYANGTKQTPLSDTNVEIASKKTTSDEDVTNVTWAADQGILLKVNADAYKGTYSGTINWTLVGKTPAP